MDLKISGYSTALFSTWFFIEELSLLFDAGDGIMANLLQKSRKIKHVFISHADRDHITGLLQFNQLNANEGRPNYYYPKDSGSFLALKNFMDKFDPHVSSGTWIPLNGHSEIEIKNQIFVEAFINDHIKVQDKQCKSLSYVVHHRKSKLKEAFKDLSNDEIKKIALDKGKSFISEEHSKKILAYSGDCPIGNQEKWDGTQILIHEATFLNMDNIVENNAHKHSLLEDVIKMAAEIKIETLVLSHFSVRYKKEEIDAAIRKYCKAYKLKIPVHRILPGQFAKNILTASPINA